MAGQPDRLGALELAHGGHGERLATLEATVKAMGERLDRIDSRLQELQAHHLGGRRGPLMIGGGAGAMTVGVVELLRFLGGY